MSTDHVSDLRFDRHIAGELSPEESTLVVVHAGECARCGDRLRELTAGRDDFAKRPTPIMFAQAKAKSRSRRTVWLGAAGAIAAAAVVVLVVKLRGPAPVGVEDPGVRVKGAGRSSPVLILAAGSAGAMTPLSTGDTIRAGDSLQAGYSSDRDGYGAVVARDGAGEAMAYVPMVALPAGTDRLFPSSTTLDDVLGRETIHLVWCEAARPIEPLVAAARAGHVVAPPGCHVRTLALEKRAR